MCIKLFIETQHTFTSIQLDEFPQTGQSCVTSTQVQEQNTVGKPEKPKLLSLLLGMKLGLLESNIMKNISLYK